MQINLELPDDIFEALQTLGDEPPRRTLELWAVEGYRSGALSESQVRRMLGFQTRFEVHGFLKKAGVPLDYTETDLNQDLQTHQKLGIIPDR